MKILLGMEPEDRVVEVRNALARWERRELVEADREEKGALTEDRAPRPREGAGDG